MTNRVGQQIGNYCLVRLLGCGGFADVYLGQHIHLKNRQVAIKILKSSLDRKYATTFLEEAQTIADLRHSHIVQIIDYGIEDTSKLPYIIMEYAQKGMLRDIYPKGTMVSLKIVVSCIKQIAEALQYAHDRKIIHCDLKPQNFLVRGTNEILLSDFGIATIAKNTMSLHTGDYRGTLYYSAPEQLQGKPRLASDQYALGIIAYELICGSVPFTGSQAEIITKHLTEAPPPLRHLISAVEAAVMRALKKEPNQRFGSVREFSETLEAAANYRSNKTFT